MGGNRTQPTNSFPSGEVKGIINDAGDRIGDATKSIGKKAKGYRADANTNQGMFGLYSAGDSEGMRTVTSTSFDNPAAQTFLGKTIDQGKKGDYGISQYNNASDVDRMYQDFKGLYGDKAPDFKGRGLRGALIEAEQKGYVSHDDDYNLKNARGFKRFLDDKAKGDFTTTTSTQEAYDRGRDTLTGRTISQAMGDYRKNYQQTIGDITKDSRGYIENYESGLLSSQSVQEMRAMLAKDSKIFEDNTNRYREGAYNTLSKATDKGEGNITRGESRAMDRIDNASKIAFQRQTGAIAPAEGRQTGAAERGRQQSILGYSNAATAAQTAAQQGYGTALYNSARQNFGTRANEGYARYGNALNSVAQGGRQYTQDANLNMLRNNAYQAAAAAPPTFRMNAALQNQLGSIANYGSYGGSSGAASRGDIRNSLTTNYDFGFGQKDTSGNYKRNFDRTNLIANNAQPFYNAIQSRGFNFNPGGSRQNYGFTAGTNFESRSRGQASKDYYNRFMGGYAPRG